MSCGSVYWLANCGSNIKLWKNSPVFCNSFWFLIIIDPDPSSNIWKDNNCRATRRFKFFLPLFPSWRNIHWIIINRTKCHLYCGPHRNGILNLNKVPEDKSFLNWSCLGSFREIHSRIFEIYSWSPCIHKIWLIAQIVSWYNSQPAIIISPSESDLSNKNQQ